ncbi:MAG: phage integrase N-terminal SAM-like domain-containing protein [Candidatus Thiodiazotropha sp.]
MTTTRTTVFFPITWKSHLAHINCFLLFHSEKHPCDCEEIELASFLEHLALNRKVSGKSVGFKFPACPDHDRGD